MAKQNSIKRIISSPLVQTFLIYLSGGWIALEMTDYFIRKYNLSERISDVLSIILLIGLPVAILLAWYLGSEKDEGEEITTDTTTDKKKQGLFTMRKKTWIFIPGTLLLLLFILAGTRFIHRRIKTKWAREEGLLQMDNFLKDLDYLSAFQLRQEVKKYIPNDPEFLDLDGQISTRFSIITEPPGAKVYYKVYSDMEGDWKLFGTSPIDRIEMPNGTMYCWKMEKPGYEVVYAGHATYTDTLFRNLHKTGTIPEGMVYVEGIIGEDHSVTKSGFFMDKYEVINRQFKEFMDQGGYQNPEFWHHEFILDDKILSFKEAIEYFRDATGRPGPATWEAGDYPDGQDNYPVNGITWYEAAAYAEYAGKSLPTMDHWRSAAGLNIVGAWIYFCSLLVPESNMKGIGTEPVGHSPAVNCFGTYDLIGNVREWGWNKSSMGRIIQGGAWNEADYMAFNVSQLSEFDRSPKNGFRCVRYPLREQIPDQAFMPVEIELRDYRYEKPVSEIEFQILKKQFLYDKNDLNSYIDERDESPVDWILEKVSFDAAYEKERMVAYLFLPKEAVPPFQTVILYPGSGAQRTNSFHEFRRTRWELEYIIKNGRAAILPIYKGTIERRDGTCDPGPPLQSHQYNECLVKWVKDFCRSIDYLETRKEIDTSRIAYLGFSWGGNMGGIIPAVEDRIKLCIFIAGGLRKVKILPEADPLNYVSHVEVPVLMLNGRYDYVFPYETNVKPMFDLLGTPEQDKKLIPYDVDHFVPQAEKIKEVLDWLDMYFGPVQKVSSK